MPGKKPVIGALLVVALAYVVYPYVALYRLGLAIRHGDAATLESMVDWSAVREGIKEDICDSVIDQPSQASGSCRHSVRGSCAASHPTPSTLQVTPEALASAAQQSETASVPQGAAVRVSWAFFSGPSAFEVDLAAPGQTGADQAADGTAGWHLAGDAGLAAAASAGRGQRPDIGQGLGSAEK